jgi:ABC-type branched-subunit amino acid transport system substrate-binding protein
MNRRKFLGAGAMLSVALASGKAFAASGDIVLGQSVPLSGPAKDLGIEMRDGALVWFNAINAKGGVGGRNIRLETLDDGYEPERTKVNTEAFVKKSVSALFGYVGTPTSLAAKPIFEQANLPFVAPFTGAEALRSPNHPLIFNVRASYFEETEHLINHFWSLGQQKVAVFHQNDAYGQAGLNGVLRALGNRGAKVVATGTAERNSANVDAALKAILPAAPDVIVIVSTYGTAAAFIKQARAQGSPASFANISFVGPTSLANALGKDKSGVMVSQVVPLKGLGVYSEFARMLPAGTAVTPVALEGFIAAKVMSDALKRASGQDGLLSALNATNLDVGGYRVKFSSGNHAGSKYVDLSMLRPDGSWSV